LRYDIKKFKSAVNSYIKVLKKTNAKTIFIYGNINKKSFFSMAPFTMACSELDIDVVVSFTHNIKETSVLFDIWKTYEEIKNKRKTPASVILNELLKLINIKELNACFKRPDLILAVKEDGLYNEKIKIMYDYSWFSPYMENELRETSQKIIKEVYALKPSELFSIGFVVLPKEDHLPNPLQDFLDSYSIAYNIFEAARENNNKIKISASSERTGMHDKPVAHSELLTTLVGLELEKEIDLPIFKKYKLLSTELGLDRIKIPSANFFVSTKGYHGKHYLGERIGYPTKNKKSRWSSPGGMIYKFPWYPQSDYEDRDPISRVAFTSTVPIERFVESTLIDYKEMRRRNKKISDILKKCTKVFVKSNLVGGSNFEVGLVKKGVHRRILGSDSDVRTIVSKRILKETGKKYGRMANIPGGESFTTPSYVTGRIVGDVVINIDKSYRLSQKEPFIVESTKKGYRLISAPKIVKDAFIKKKKDAWKNILLKEKHGSIEKKIINLEKRNFEHIGEFAINTNPNAKLCDYLIINEKIANMIHVAFGSGFEADASTEYHMDVVIDSPRQKLDIYGITKDKQKKFIIRDGIFVV